MAKLIEEQLFISFSQLIKNNELGSVILTDEFLESLEQVLSELVGTNVLVEIVKSEARGE